MPRQNAATASSPLQRKKRSRPEPDEPAAATAAAAAQARVPSKRARRTTKAIAAPDDGSDLDGGMHVEEDEENGNGSTDHDTKAVESPGRRGPSANGATPTPSRRDRAAADPKTPSSRTKHPSGSVPHTPSNAITPRRRRAADRSARKKSMRSMIERIVDDDGGRSDEDELQGDLAREIYESGEDSEDPEDDDSDSDAAAAAATPTKSRLRTTPTTPSRRGGRRPPARSPSPLPRNLPPHEQFFLDTRPGRPKTSNNTLASAGLDLLSHDEYFATLRRIQAAGPAPHAADVRFLEDMHAQSFPQWAFELREGFGLCLYGLGSKRRVVRRFADFLQPASAGGHDKIVIVNGYVKTISPRDVLAAMWAVLFPLQKLPSTQPATILQAITAHLARPSPPATVTLIVNSVDAPPFRRAPCQTLLVTLAATLRSAVRIVCTADTPDFALLWDAGRRTALDLVFHDCTTFAPLTVAEIDVVDEVHELLGRRARRAGGREGVAFVLRSLPDKARRMFVLLVAEVLTAMEDEGSGGGGGGGGENPGVEYRMVYNKAVEEFICGSEMGFRTLLKEFYDHEMIVSRTDALGTEMLSVPFRREELEAIMEDLCNEGAA